MNSQNDFQGGIYPPAYQPVPPSPVGKFCPDGYDTVFAWLIFIFGYLFCRSIISDAIGLGAFIVSALWCAAVPVYLRLKGKKQSAWNILYVLLSVAFTSVYFISDNVFIKLLVTLYVLISMMYYMLFAQRGGFIKGDFVYDLIKAVIVLPFRRFSRIFPSAFCFRGKKGGKLGQALLGIGIAIIPTSIVLALLYNADEGFASLLDKIFDISSWNIGQNLLWLWFGIPLAMYIFGGMISGANGEGEELMKPEQTEKFTRSLRFIPAVASYVSVIPVCAVYVLFMAVQSSYIFGGFSSVRPQELTYAQYAREGFGQLCAAAAFNLLIILCLILFTKRPEDKKPLAQKLFVILLSLLTLLLIATATAKLVMYIDAYGLTAARIYPGWFMALLTATFILIIVKQIFNNFNYFLALFLAFVSLFAVLCFSDVDARIAQYNVNAYVTGKLEKIDLDELSGLSASAVPYIVPLLEDEDAEVRAKAKTLFFSDDELKETLNSLSIWKYDLPKLAYRKLLEQ